MHSTQGKSLVLSHKSQPSSQGNVQYAAFHTQYINNNCAPWFFMRGDENGDDDGEK